MFDTFKQATLAHCLRMASVDPDYALWAGGEYERQMPWLLANLKRKVEQEIKRSRASAPGKVSAPGVSGRA